MPAANFKWNQLGALAQSFYHRYAKYDLAELRKEFEILVDNLIQWILELPDEVLFQPQVRDWTGEKWAMVKWIQINTVAPYQTARKKVRAWKRKRISA